ncbi:MAG: PepSY domain-containing protein [Clostridia bacterium]|nr:PepSY domain-containing protein [Clostridia bacterium]
MMKRMLLMLIVLLLPAAALSETLTEPMTEADMAAIWQSSFDRMGTYGAVNQSGELPQKGMISYDTALETARQAIISRYGTPEEELDAMGVYPDYYTEEWHLYFSPARNGDVDYDGGYYAAPGAYRVYLDAWTGEITYCNWYMDEFWNYAQRVWDRGDRDVVYGRAQGVSFFSQSREKQAYFIKLMEDAGYDVAVIDRSPERILLRKTLDIMFADPADVVQPEDDPLIRRAWDAVEAYTGLEADVLRSYAYCATYSEMDTGTRDVFIAYNYEQEFLWQEDRIGEWEGLLFSFARCLGNFMVQLDSETGEALNVVHVYPDEEAGSQEFLLRRRRWTADDFRAFDQAYKDYARQMKEAAAAGKSRGELNALSYELMHPLRGDVGPYRALELAQEAAASEAGMPAEKFRAVFTGSSVFYSRDDAYEIEFWSEEGPIWRVTINAMDGAVLSADQTDGEG